MLEPRPCKKSLLLVFLCAFAALAVHAQSLNTLAAFDGNNGEDPLAGVIQATDGNFYGTTDVGGTGAACGTGIGCGVVYAITPSGTLSIIYNFCSQTGCTDGSAPEDALIQAADGNFYGTTFQGGANNFGTVFSLTTGGVLNTLYSFCARLNCTDGEEPAAGVVQATDGNFYGTAEFGGTNGAGTVFKITPAGGFSILYGFCATTPCNDGSNPAAGLIQARDGNFYGTTRSGGTNGEGVIFSVTPAGAYTNLYSFCPLTGCADGSAPQGSLLQATDGNFYGTTEFGGGPNNSGTIFRFTPPNTLTNLYTFCLQANCPDSFGPIGNLIQASDGNLYGLASGLSVGLPAGFCLSASCGAIFRLTLSGTFTTLYSFCALANCADGSTPLGSLVQGTDGKFYSTTSGGGATGAPCPGCGTVFGFTAPLPGATLSSGSINFGNQAMGFGTSPIPVMLKNTGGEPLTIFGIADGNGFSETNNCPISPATLAIGQSCTINITFTPGSTGTLTDNLVITDNAIGSPQIVQLSGVGQAPFALTTNCTSLSVVPGQTAIYTVSLAPGKGFAQSVSLACSGAPNLANCTVNPASFIMDGSTPVQAQVTATTTPATTVLLRSPYESNRFARLMGLAGIVGLAALVVLPGKRRGNHARRLCGFLFCLCLLSTMLTTASCGGGGAGSDPPGTAAGTYPLTVTATYQPATGNAFTEKVSFNLVVQ